MIDEKVNHIERPGEAEIQSLVLVPFDQARALHEAQAAVGIVALEVCPEGIVALGRFGEDSVCRQTRRLVTFKRPET